MWSTLQTDTRFIREIQWNECRLNYSNPVFYAAPRTKIDLVSDLNANEGIRGGQWNARVYSEAVKETSYNSMPNGLSVLVLAPHFPSGISPTLSTLPLSS